MDGEVLQLPVEGVRVIVVHRPESPTTSVAATYARGFGHDPVSAPGVAHLYEHLHLSTLRAVMVEPLMAQAQTHADTMRVSATVLAGAEHELVTALARASRALVEGAVDDAVRARECRAIDVELSEWFSNPLLVAGHKIAALATRRPQLARFDECRLGASARITLEDLRAHAAQREVAYPERLVIVGARPAEAWLPLLAPLNPAGPAPGATTDGAGQECGSLWPDLNLRSGLSGAGGRVFVGIPLHLTAPGTAEAAWLAAQALLHEHGPLADVANRAGARFRGGSVVPATGGVVVTGSWIAEDARQREAIGIAVSQHSGHTHPDLIAAQVASLAERRSASGTNSATLAAAVDDWQVGYGIDPTAAGAPSPEQVNDLMQEGWGRAVLVGANPARGGPF